MARSHRLARARYLGRQGIALSLVAFLGLSGCVETFRTHGYAPNDADLETVVIGQDTRETLGDKIGRPTLIGVMEQSDWYFVRSRWRYYGLNKPQEVERQVIAVRFDDSGRAQNIERYALQDGAVVDLSRRTTSSNIKGISFIKQLLGNFGRLSADQIAN